MIANVAPAALLKLTGSTGNGRYDGRMAGFQHAPGTMMIHLAMDDLPDWIVPELREFAYVHLAPSLDQMARTYQQAKARQLPDTPIIVTGQPTVFDPSRAPDGKHVLWLQVRMVPGVIKGDAAGSIDATDWADVAEPYAERALDIVEQYAPGTREKIIARRVVTPTELEADNPISSAAIRYAAAIICFRISCFARCADTPTGAPRSTASITPAPASGRAPAREPDRVTCSARN